MPINFRCDKCDARMRVDDHRAGTSMRCPECDQRNTVPGSKAGPCPGCGTPLPAKTVLCIECGFNLESGKKMTTRVKRLDETLDAGLSPLHRAINLVIGLGLIVALGLTLHKIAYVKLAAALVLIATLGAIFALCISTFYRLRIERLEDGSLQISKLWHVLFIPIGVITVDLTGYDAVVLDYRESGDDDTMAIANFIMMATLFGAVGAILFGQVAFGHLFTVSLKHPGIREPLRLYRGRSEILMRRLTDCFQELDFEVKSL